MDLFSDSDILQAMLQVQDRRDYYLSIAASVCDHDKADKIAFELNDVLGERYGNEHSEYKSADVVIGLILLVDAMLAHAVVKGSPEVPDGQNNTQGESKTYAN